MTRMIKYLAKFPAIVALWILPLTSLSAQDYGKVSAVPAGKTIEVTDQGDTIFILPPAVDSSLVGRDIVNMIATGAAGDVSLRQSPAIETALRNHIGRNGSRHTTGYRIRIYFDNSQKSRSASSSVAASFAAQFPGIRVYRVYENPYFKVTVGDFRTKTDALRFRRRIEGMYPSSFIVKETINYPEL